jgi:hypothetical protein
MGCPNPAKDIIIYASIADNHPTHYHIPLKSRIPPWVIINKERSLSILENNFWDWKKL